MNISAINSVSPQPTAPVVGPTVRAKTPAFTAAAMRHAAPAEQRAAVAKQFEAILVRQLLGKTMNSMLGGESGGVAGSVYGDMLADTISQQLTAERQHAVAPRQGLGLLRGGHRSHIAGQQRLMGDEREGMILFDRDGPCPSEHAARL